MINEKTVINNRSYLLTGASGFLGSIISAKLSLNNNVLSVGRSLGCMYNCDLSKEGIPLQNTAIDVVIHAAGKAHSIPRTKEEEDVFYEVNVTGTLNLLSSLEGLPNQLTQFVFISTVAVYGRGSGECISEEHPLNGDTIYAKTKIEAEQIIGDWCEKRKIPLIILRVPLIVGEYPPGNLGAMIAGISSGKYASIGKANARKSMVLADDIAVLISRLDGASGTYNLTDGYNPSFREMEEVIALYFKKNFFFKIPHFVAISIAKLGDLLGKSAPFNSSIYKKISSPLTFSDKLAVDQLNWQPRQVLKNPDLWLK